MLVLLLVSMLTLAFNIQTARCDGTQVTDRPWYDMVNLKSGKIIDFNVVSGEKFFEAKQNAGGEVKEDVIPTVLYPNGEIYYYVEQTSQNGVVYYLRYFPGIPACTEVTIYVQDSNGPVYDAFVEIFTGDDIFVESGFTDIGGNYETCLEDGEYYTEVTHPSTGAEKVATFSLPNDTYVSIIFCTGVTIYVQDSSGNPLSASVKIFDEYGVLIKEGSTNAETGDVIFCLESGTYAAKATDEFGKFAWSDPFTVPDTTYVTIVFGCVTVHAQYSDGSPVPYADVFVFGGEGSYYRQTDENGIAIFGTLVANTEYAATAEKGSLSGSSYFTTNSAGGADVVVDIGPSTCVIVTVLHDDNPVAGATVSIWSGELLIATGTTDASGVAIVETLDPNTLYVAKAEKDNLLGTNLFTTNCAGGAEVTIDI